MCAVTFAVAGHAVATAPVTSTPAVLVAENLRERRHVKDPKEQALILESFEDW